MVTCGRCTSDELVCLCTSRDDKSWGMESGTLAGKVRVKRLLYITVIDLQFIGTGLGINFFSGSKSLINGTYFLEAWNTQDTRGSK